MKRRLLLATAAILALPLVASFALSLLLATSSAQMRVAAAVSRALRRPVRFTSVSVHPFPFPRLRVEQLEIAQIADFGTTPFLRVERADLWPEAGPLLRGRLELAAIVLKKPALTIVRDADGQLNVTTPGPGAEPEPKTQASESVPEEGPRPRAIQVRIEDGTVTYIRHRRSGRTTELGLAHLDLKLTGESRLALEGSARLEPGGLLVDIAHGMIDPSGARRPIESPVSAEIALRGDDVTDLIAALLGPKVAIGGALQGKLTIGGTLSAPTAAGPLTLSGATLAMDRPHCKPERRRLALPKVTTNLQWEAGRVTGDPTTAEVGSGKVSANVSIALDGDTEIELKDLRANALPLGAILVDFLCAGHAVTGALDLDGHMSIVPRSASNPVSGAGRIRIAKGKVVGEDATELVSAVLRLGGAVSALLNADLPRSLISSPLDFDSITADYRIADRVVRFSDLAYVNDAMTVAGDGQVELARDRLDVELKVKHGRGLVRVKVTGSTDSPKVRIIPSTLLRDVDPRAVERGVESLLKHLR